MDGQAWEMGMSEIGWPRRPRTALDRVRTRLFGQSEMLLGVAGIGAWLLDAQTSDLWWSAETFRLHGLSPERQPSVTEAVDFYAPHVRDDIMAAVRTSIDAAAGWDVELPLRRADGVSIWVRARGQAFDQPDGQRFVLGTFEDVTERRKAAELLRDVIEGIPAAVTVYDRDERLLLVNNGYRNVLPTAAAQTNPGDTLESILRRKVEANYYDPEVRGDAPEAVREAWIADYLQRHRAPDYERVFELSNGRFVQASNAKLASGNIVTIRTDITALKQAEAKLRRLAEHDPLTGLANRAVLLQRISDAKDQGRHMAEPGKLILFDIDHFKAVNDGLGHAIGDLLLRIVARRLKRLLPPHCTAARLGGDEFALVAPGVTAAELPEFMGRLFAHLKRPMRLGRARYTPSISAGVTRLHADEKGQGTDTMIRAGALLSRADAALQEAKKQGRARWVRHDNVLAARIARRIRLADRLRTAIAQDRLEIAIQPQEDLATGRIKGFEALARWQDEGQWVPPPEFVGIAEDSGQAQALGNRILDKALAAQARMLADGLAPGLMAVNVSTAQLLAEDFPETIRRLLAKHGLSPAQLELEITETVLLDHSAERIASILEDLRSRGISLSLDDFGTGYASMAHVSRFPVHRIKIDRSFVSGIGVCRPSHDAARNGGLVARSLILLGRGLGLDVVAEGVETEAQKRYLAARGCTTMQGWLLARPMAPEAAHQWLATREQRRAKASASMAASRRHRLCTT